MTESEVSGFCPERRVKYSSRNIPHFLITGNCFIVRWLTSSPCTISTGEWFVSVTTSPSFLSPTTRVSFPLLGSGPWCHHVTNPHGDSCLICPARSFSGDPSVNSAAMFGRGRPSLGAHYTPTTLTRFQPERSRKARGIQERDLVCLITLSTIWAQWLREVNFRRSE